MKMRVDKNASVDGKSEYGWKKRVWMEKVSVDGKSKCKSECGWKMRTVQFECGASIWSVLCVSLSVLALSVPQC
jgi:hypothetical protein